MATIIATACGCGILFRGSPSILDWNRLPTENIQIGWLRAGNTEYTINTTFSDVPALLEYLNSTFVEDYEDDFKGVFYANGTYSNPENYTSLEIMAILDTAVQRFGMLPDYPTLNVDVIEVADSNVITHASLEDCEVLQVQVGYGISLPITSSGWEHDSDAGTLTFPIDNQPSGQIISVLTKQTT